MVLIKKEKLKKLLTKVFLKYKLSKAHAKHLQAICNKTLCNNYANIMQTPRQREEPTLPPQRFSRQPLSHCVSQTRFSRQPLAPRNTMQQLCKKTMRPDPNMQNDAKSTMQQP